MKVTCVTGKIMNTYKTEGVMCLHMTPSGVEQKLNPSWREWSKNLSSLLSPKELLCGSWLVQDTYNIPFGWLVIVYYSREMGKPKGYEKLLIEDGKYDIHLTKPPFDISIRQASKIASRIFQVKTINTQSHGLIRKK